MDVVDEYVEEVPAVRGGEVGSERGEGDEPAAARNGGIEALLVTLAAICCHRDGNRHAGVTVADEHVVDAVRIAGN